ncbi:hypothetical protein ABT352_24340 [Streptosporangium sp. NPDC000563]|uniref:hypothetical protein n=1 Tax=unclassified Streptosporangium TaxID=2632669 RepID=UPI0033182F84
MTDAKEAKDSRNKAAKSSGKSKKATIKATRAAKEARKHSGQPEVRVPEAEPAHPGGRSVQ